MVFKSVFTVVHKNVYRALGPYLRTQIYYTFFLVSVFLTQKVAAPNLRVIK